MDDGAQSNLTIAISQDIDRKHLEFVGDIDNEHDSKPTARGADASPRRLLHTQADGPPPSIPLLAREPSP